MSRRTQKTVKKVAKGSGSNLLVSMHMREAGKLSGKSQRARRDLGKSFIRIFSPVNEDEKFFEGKQCPKSSVFHGLVPISQPHSRLLLNSLYNLSIEIKSDAHM